MATLFPEPDTVLLADGATLLPAIGMARSAAIVAALRDVLQQAPARHMVTPGGQTMSVAASNCGRLGWVSDRRGYRYQPLDPLSGQPWPAMPEGFEQLAHEAAARAGFDGFAPDACLISVYAPGARLGLHQDRDEADVTGHPLVSLSLGLSAVFQLGGLARTDKTIKVPVAHGDAIVWGGAARLRYHGVATVKDGEHPLLGRQRINLSFRHAG